MLKWIKLYWKAAMGFGIIVFLLLSMVTYQECSISKLREETREAETEAKVAEQVVKDAEKRAEEVARRTEEQLRQVNQIIADMRKAVDESRARERVALSNLRQMVVTRDMQIDSVRSDTDSELTFSLGEMVPQLYPENTGAQVSYTTSGILINRMAAEAFKKSLLETASRRVEDIQLREVISEKDMQMEKLETIIEQRNVSLVAIGDRVTALEEHVQSLVSSSEAKDRQIEALIAELKAERRKNFWSKWYGRSLTVAALVGGMVIGGMVAG